MPCYHPKVKTLGFPARKLIILSRPWSLCVSTHTTPSVRFASRAWSLFRGLLQSIMTIAISQSPSRPSSRPSTSKSSRYMTADVEQTQSNGSDRMAPILYRPVLLPVPRVARRGGIELCGAGVDTGGRAGRVEWRTGRAADTDDKRAGQTIRLTG